MSDKEQQTPQREQQVENKPLPSGAVETTVTKTDDEGKTEVSTTLQEFPGGPIISMDNHNPGI